MIELHLEQFESPSTESGCEGSFAVEEVGRSIADS
jgi:hypothetical protein